MREIEGSTHLFEPPTYILEDKSYYSSFNDALEASEDVLTIDYGALVSFFSYGYVTGDRTIFNEIKRKPWLSHISSNGKVVLEPIPIHDFFASDYKNISDRFYELLLSEARKAVYGFDQIYVLLSGGLDSRIVAGLVGTLYDNGEITKKPIGLTWGLENSRDVQYGKRMANILNFDWEYIPILPETVLKNILITGKKLGLIHSPELLHNMNWINENTKPNSLVLAGSFGDSIGRGEFSGQHLLTMNTPPLTDSFKILSDRVHYEGDSQVLRDIVGLKDRSNTDLKYALNEHFMQGYRMRNGLCHALSIVNDNSRIYQMFTSPSVYEFIWSLHPSFRDDKTYENLLNDYFPELARVPWARTNKALGGKTIGARKDLLKDYHLYTKWSREELSKELESIIDIAWFEKTGLFNKEGLINLRNIVKNSHSRVSRTNEFWLWLAGFKKLIDQVNDMGKTIDFKIVKAPINTNEQKNLNYLKVITIKYISKSEVLTRLAKKIRRLIQKNKLRKIKRSYLEKYPLKKFKK